MHHKVQHAAFATAPRPVHADNGANGGLLTCNVLRNHPRERIDSELILFRPMNRLVTAYRRLARILGLPFRLVRAGLARLSELSPQSESHSDVLPSARCPTAGIRARRPTKILVFQGALVDR